MPEGSAPPLTGAQSSDGVAARAVDAVKVYGSGEVEVRALDGLSVDFAAGRFTAIMGPSGSGQSTLLHCLAGLDRLSSGAVRLGEVDLTKLGDRQLTLLRRELLFLVVLSGLAGMLAAALPARRAARLDVLAAIAFE